MAQIEATSHEFDEFSAAAYVRSLGLTRSLGALLANWIVPEFIAKDPRVGPRATALVSWLPTVLVACVALRFYVTRRAPGDLPPGLVEAFNHLPS